MTVPKASPWFPRAATNASARLRLICLPYAGGGASIYRTWSEALGPDVEVCPAELPGRGARLGEPAVERADVLVDQLAVAVRPLLDRPFALFGHSMGAVLVFELARTLRRVGAPEPRILFVAGRGAPQRSSGRRPVHDLPDAEFVAYLRSLNGTPREVLEHAELLELLMPMLRADFAVVDTYAYEPEAPLACPIAAFGGLEDPDVGRDAIDDWRAQTSGPFVARMLPGDHFFLRSAQAMLLRLIAREIAALAPG